MRERVSVCPNAGAMTMTMTMHLQGAKGVDSRRDPLSLLLHPQTEPKLLDNRLPCSH